ncbi:MAG: hypothetical protein QG671_17 [Actinomycetota bacterium]|nr:hypothetical protein [Actinomycetota bacterium]
MKRPTLVLSTALVMAAPCAIAVPMSAASASQAASTSAAVIPAAVNPAAAVSVDVTRGRHPIDPRIYGVAFAGAATLTDLGATINRSGGNPATRYNWQLNADNRGSDWFFESLGDASAVPGARIDAFMAGNKAAGAQSMVTIPMIGQVAKLGPGRARLASFSVAKYGPQQATDQWFPDAGNGLRTNGSAITGNNPADANMPANSTYQQAWVNHIVAAAGAATATNPRYYLYDNEASIWHGAHRDVHPVGATMDEYANKVIDYGTKLRAADPGALLVGPEEWGWGGLIYSGYDQQWGASHGWTGYPDRAAHGNVDYFPWLLSRLRTHQQATGVRLLDVASAHWYPQGGEFGNDVSTAMQLRRNRSTRSLWDPNYTDESWINDRVQLIPRLKAWVAANYPGTKVGLTEYNWGAEGHMSGAVAQADVLGILGREGADLATRWTTPAAGSPAYQAFRLFRNYDGKHSTFGSTSVQTTVTNPDNVAAFAATRPDGTTTVMLLNKYLSNSTPINLAVAGLPSTPTAAQVWQLAGGSTQRVADARYADGKLSLTVPAQSVTLVVLPRPTPPPPPPAVPTYSATSVASPATVTAGSPTTITTKVTVANAPATARIVDVEVYSSAWLKVFQRWSTGQSFATGQTRNYQHVWTPTVPGSYRVAVGVFTDGWTSNPYWLHSAATIVVKPRVLAVPAGRRR